MNVLMMSDTSTMPVRNSVVFHFSKLIGLIREGRAVFFCALGEKRQTEKIGTEQIARYRAGLVYAGVHVLDGASTAHCRPASTARCSSSGIRRHAALGRCGRDTVGQVRCMGFRKYLLCRFGDCPEEVRYQLGGR